MFEVLVPMGPCIAVLFPTCVAVLDSACSHFNRSIPAGFGGAMNPAWQHAGIQGLGFGV